jgi:hypothetical protein
VVVDRHLKGLIVAVGKLSNGGDDIPEVTGGCTCRLLYVQLYTRDMILTSKQESQILTVSFSFIGSKLKDI